MAQRNTKLLYLHAYQSIVWNKAVSQRIKKYGFQVLIGDMVLMPEENKGEFSNSVWDQRVETMKVAIIYSHSFFLEFKKIPI
jgi:tRNA(Glu) U13 pseudouridine synthase TruD